MKIIKFTFLSFMFLAFTTVHAQKQKEYLTGNQIPSEITSYVQKHFPNSNILKVKKETKPLKTEYEVKLSPKAELEFDGDLKIKEVESKAGIPMSVLPQKINSYVTQNYANVGIKEWKLKDGGHKVKLLSGPKLYFDNDGKFVAQKG